MFLVSELEQASAREWIRMMVQLGSVRFGSVWSFLIDTLPYLPDQLSDYPSKTKLMN